LFAEFIFRERTTRSVLLAPERDGRSPKAPKNLKKRLRTSIASGWKFRRRRPRLCLEQTRTLDVTYSISDLNADQIGLFLKESSASSKIRAGCAKT